MVFVATYSGEGHGREDLLFVDGGEKLINATAATCSNTIVIIHNTGPFTVKSWIDHPNVTAFVAAYTPGEQTGNAIVPILYGDVSPSGKLPYTIGKSLADWSPNTIIAEPTINAPQAYFNESLKIYYRWFDTFNTQPLFEFGFGMSYSNFSF